MFAKKLSEICDESFHEMVEGEVYRIDIEKLDGKKWCVIYLVDADEGMICITSPEYVSRLAIQAGQAIRVQGPVHYHTRWQEVVLRIQEIEKISSNPDWQKCQERKIDKILAHTAVDLPAAMAELNSTEKAFCAVRNYYADACIPCRQPFLIMLVESIVQRAINYGITTRP